MLGIQESDPVLDLEGLRVWVRGTDMSMFAWGSARARAGSRVRKGFLEEETLKRHLEG